MPQYLISVIDSDDPTYYPSEADEAAAHGEGGAVEKFNQKLQANGHWVFAEGLAPRTSATVIDNRGPEKTVTDGPYLESKEYLGGFWIIEATGRDQALELASEASRVCVRKVEVRGFGGEGA